MSLIKCNECKKKISTDVDKCPSCGHKISQEYKDKETDKQDRAKTIGIVIIGIVICYMIYSYNDTSKTAVAKTTAAAEQTQKIKKPQKKDLEYYGSENEGKAIYYAKDRIEQLARFGCKWDAGYFDAEMFYTYQWYDKSKLIIKYVGNGIKIENAFGAWRQADYYCIYDIPNEQVLSVGMR